MSALHGGIGMRATIHAAGLAQRMPDDWPGKTHSRLARAAGLDWHIQVHGDDGPTVLMLHGAGASLHSWAGLISALSGGYRVIAIDLPGHAFSDAFAAGSYTLTRTAAAITTLMDALGEAPDMLVGHSAGGAIAMQMLVDRGDDAARPYLVAINPALMPFSGLAGIAFPVMARVAAGSGLLARLIASRASSRSQVERLIAGTGSHLDAAGIARYQWLMKRPEHVSAVLSMMAGWRLDHLLPSLRRLDPAMQFIVGAEDLAVPPVRLGGITQELHNTQVTRLTGLGHLAHEESPAAVWRVLRDALPVALRSTG